MYKTWTQVNLDTRQGFEVASCLFWRRSIARKNKNEDQFCTFVPLAPDQPKLTVLNTQTESVGKPHTFSIKIRGLMHEFINLRENEFR